MNTTTYVFGTFDDGFAQYPSDYVARLLQHGATLTDAPTAMVLHREGSLMYYSYIRRLERQGKRHYIGFCTVFNGIYLPHVHTMTGMYERLITNLVKMGQLVRLDDAGHVVAAVKNLKGQQQMVARIQAYITKSLAPLEKDQQLLPPAAYAVSNTHTEHFDVEATEQDVAAKATKGGYVVISKASDYEDEQLTGYKATVARLMRERDELQKKNNELVASVRKALHQEHRTRKWVIALLSIGLIVWGFNALMQHLEHTQENLDTAVNTITGQRDRITGLNNTIDMLKQQAAGEKRAREKTEKEFRTWLRQVGEYIPMLVLDVEVANVTESNQIINDYSSPLYVRNVQYLKPRLRYIGIRPDEEAHIFVRLYDPSGRIVKGLTSPEGYTYQQTVMVAEGEHELPLMGWGIPESQLQRGMYRFEFWHGHICIKALDFRLY